MLFAFYCRLTPQNRSLRKKIIEGKFDCSDEMKEHIASMRLSLNDPTLAPILSKLKARKEAKKDEQQEQNKEQPWYSKIFTSTVDY